MPKAKCPQCATVVTYAAGYDPICPQCGFRGAAPAPPPVAPARWTPHPEGPSTQPAAAAYAATPPSPAGYGAPPAGRQQGMAVAALVCGIGALFVPFVGLVAAVLGGIAMGNADRDPQRYGGKGMALTGLILGIVFSLLWFTTFGFGDPWNDSPWDDSWWDW